jgi:hypothetical protein
MFESKMLHYKKKLGKEVYEQLEVGQFHTDALGKSVNPQNSTISQYCLKLTIWNGRHEIHKIIKSIQDIKTMRKAMLKMLDGQ